MFASFSSGYYVGRLVIEPHDGDEALLQREQHEEVNRQLYATGDGVERIDYPLLMKFATAHFPVSGAESVPYGTLLLPRRFISPNDLDPLPAIREVLLAKPEIVPRLLEWAGDGSDIVGT